MEKVFLFITQCEKFKLKEVSAFSFGNSLINYASPDHFVIWLFKIFFSMLLLPKCMSLFSSEESEAITG